VNYDGFSSSFGLLCRVFAQFFIMFMNKSQTGLYTPPRTPLLQEKVKRENESDTSAVKEAKRVRSGSRAFSG
jgi:hypothetical protein